MKNSTNHLSKIKLISALATLATVLLLVAAVPLFVNAQTANPPSNNVDATFNSVTVNDGATNRLSLSSTGTISNPVPGFPPPPVTINDSLDINGDITSVTGSIKLYDDNGTDFGNNFGTIGLSVTSDGYLRGYSPGVRISDDSGLEIYSQAGVRSFLFNTDGSFTGPAAGGVKIKDNQGLTIADDAGTDGLQIAANGDITDANSRVTINEQLLVNGDTSITGLISSTAGITSGGDISTGGSGDIFTNGTGDIYTQNGNIYSITGTVGGSIVNANSQLNAGNISLAGTISDYNSAVTIDDGLSVTGATTLSGGVSGNLSVAGNITSTGGGIGRFYNTGWSGSNTLAATSWEYNLTRSCTATDDIAIDCMALPNHPDVYIREAASSGSTCYFHFYNRGSVARSVQLRANCFSPNG